GLEFSREDFVALAREAGIDSRDELSEEDLRKVAGGIITATALSIAVTAGACVAAWVNKPKWY
ncbi:MAG: hypothetical protein LBQ36_06510, partial [Synergistaceae bacterium]|nr:hypothetical protein [Synergistaceae bacterium]